MQLLEYSTWHFIQFKYFFKIDPQGKLSIQQF